MVTEPENPLPTLSFEDLPRRLQEAAGRAGWDSLMPVQGMAIPYVMEGRDLMVHSRTGSGKTGAFVLPLLELLDPDEPTCQALVLVPTRELARQVHSAAETLFEGSGLRAVAVYGGVGYQPQLDALKLGAHLVVGTPGRILDHLQRRSMVLNKLRVLIFDEADRMLSVGFYPDMVALEAYLPEKRRGYMFSATYPTIVRSLAQQFLDKPQMLSLSHGHEHVAETDHIAYEVPALDKSRCLVRIIEIENPASAIVFCNTKANARLVATVLKRFGYDAEHFSSDLSQAAREKVLERIYKGRLRFLIATDVAARGIDITGLSHVVLYDFPEDPESYIHRTGRTGRAGASGEAISLVDAVESLKLKAVARQYKIDIESRPAPTDDDVEAIVAERVTAFLEGELRGLDKLVVERMQRMLPLAQRLSEDDDERAVIAMLLDQYYQSLQHDPPPLPTTGKVSGTRLRANRPRERDPESEESGSESSGGRTERPRRRRRRPRRPR